MFNVQHIHQQLEELQSQYKLLSQHIAQLARDCVVQAGTTVKFQLEKECEAAKAKREKIAYEINALENKLASLKKTTKLDFKDDGSEGKKSETLPIFATLDDKMYQFEPDAEDTSSKTWNHLISNLRKAQQADLRVSDGLKDSNRIITKINERGEQTQVNDNDPVEDGGVYKSRPVADKG
jgi:chromosome segregation ATPase